MEIGLIDVDGHHFPNLALMKISAYEKAQGNNVEWWNGLKHYDRVYQAKVFDDTYSEDIRYVINSDEIIKGGTGYGLTGTLPDEIEHIYPDYSLYGITKTAYGFLTRGCPRRCPFCIVSEKEGARARKVADLCEFWRGQKQIELLDPNLLACKERNELLEQLVESQAWINFSQGLDVRLLDKDNAEMLNQMRTKMIHFAWDNMEYKTRSCLINAREWLNKSDREVRVYVLTNFNTTIEQDLERVNTIRDIGFDPYVMVYDKPRAPKEIKGLQRWVNAKWIFRSCTFDEYMADIPSGARR